MKKLPLVKINLGLNQFKYKSTLLGDEYDRGSAEERLDRMRMLSAIAEQPELTTVMGQDFETMRMYWNGGQWAIDFEVTI